MLNFVVEQDGPRLVCVSYFLHTPKRALRIRIIDVDPSTI